MKIVVVIGLVAIIIALFAALVFLYRDRGRTRRMVTALAIRVGLSISLVAFLLVSYFMGWIAPQGLR
ncbi:MAG TPA: twin transmembrane helix small protein [Casimicrobiaceae bacterium]|nr:twin transmembrane helix small protein [Casimicrobiaceae bacterium]